MRTTPMPFTVAVRTGLRKYARFRGRASRAEFWWFLAFAFCVVASVDIAAGDALPYASAAACLALLSPLMAAAVRRLHDTGRSAWWLLVVLMPFVGEIAVLALLALPTEPIPNPYDEPWTARFA